jgi:hypothetical protein
MAETHSKLPFGPEGASGGPKELVAALLALQREHKSGVMEITSEGVKTSIYIASGKPVFAEEGTLGETLGRILVRQRVLTEEQYAAVIERMADPGDGSALRFGEVVVRMGFLTTEQVEAALAAQVKYKIVRCLQLEQSKWRFEANAARLRGVAHYPTTVEPLVLAAARLFEPERSDALLRPTEPSFPTLRDPATEIGQRFRLRTPELRFVISIDGKSTIASLLASMRPDSVDKRAILTALVLAEEILLRGEPRSSPGLFWPGLNEGPESTPDSLPPVLSPQLATEPTPDPGLVRPALRSIPPRPTAPPPPRAKSVRPPTPADRARVQRALVRLDKKRAVQVKVASPSTRPPANRHEARLVAEQCFQSGKAYLRANKLAQALAPLRRAAELLPDAIEYELYRDFVEFRCVSEPLKIAELAKKLRRVAQRAKKQDPASAFASYVLGHLAMLQGDYAEADRFFRHATKLDPEAIDDVRHVRIQDRRSVAPAAPAPPPAPAAPAAQAAAAAPAPAPKASPPRPAPPTPAKPPPVPPPRREVASEPLLLLNPVTPAPAVTPAPEPPPAPEPAPAPAAPPSPPVASPSPRPQPPEMPSPVAAATTAAAKPARPTSPAVPIAIAALVLGGGGFAAFHLLRTPSPPKIAVTPPTSAVVVEPLPIPSASAAVSASSAPAASTSAPAAASASATAADDASAAASASAAPSASAQIPEGFGELSTAGAASGHRIFVDGKVAGETPGTVRVPCGAHTVKLGSGGKPLNVDVPCGGSVHAGEH